MNDGAADSVISPAVSGSAGTSLPSRLRTSSFARNVGATLANRVLLLSIGLITSVVIARLLGPEGRGLYAVAVAVGAIGVQLGNLGLHASNTWAVARDRGLLGPLIANSAVVSIGIGGAAAAAVWIVAVLRPDLSPLPVGLLSLALVSVPLGLAYLLWQNLLLGTDRIRAYNGIDLLNKSLGLALIAALALAGWLTAMSAFLVVALATGLAAAVSLGLLFMDEQSGAIRPRLELLREHARYGTKAYLAAFASFLVLRLDMLMVQYLRGSKDAGYYSIAVTLAEVVFLGPVVVGTILFPRLASMGDDEHRWRVARSVAALIAALMPLAAAVAWIAGGPVIGSLFGPEFQPAEPAFAWLLPGLTALAVHTVFMNYFAAVGMPPITLVAPLVGLAINVVLNLWLIPRAGILGASLASSAAYVAMLVLSGTYFLKYPRRFSDAA